MIRAFAVGVGTVRIWLALFEGLGLLDFQSAWGRAFWVGHVDLPLYKSGPNHPGLRAVPKLGGARAFLRGLWQAAGVAAFDQSISC
jgi:hypothetical protein